MSISLLNNLADVPLAFVDTETTGASPDYGDRVIEVGIAIVQAGQVVATHQQLFDPRRPISAGITALTGITNEMVDGQPTFRDASPRLLEQLRGCVIVGHNIPFDLGFLRSEFRKAGIDLPAELPGAHVLDTVRLARRRIAPRGNGLQRLAARFNCADSTAHRALADALTTFRVMGCILEHWAHALVDVLKWQGGPIRVAGSGKAQLLPLELEEALDQQAPVEMEYVDADGAVTRRVITPLQLKRRTGELSMIAFCAMRQEKRTFKIDRIVRLTRIDPDSQVEAAAAKIEESGVPDESGRGSGPKRDGGCDRERLLALIQPASDLFKQ